jgi:hypothetical protein
MASRSAINAYVENGARSRRRADGGEPIHQNDAALRRTQDRVTLDGVVQINFRG